jgi:hypothetical protein
MDGKWFPPSWAILAQDPSRSNDFEAAICNHNFFSFCAACGAAFGPAARVFHAFFAFRMPPFFFEKPVRQSQ